MGVVRYLLAVIVLLTHMPKTGTTIQAGSLAVEGFFVISGFYMQLVINDYGVAEKGGYLRFYASRLLRIMPLYWFTLLATIAYMVGVGHTDQFRLIFSYGTPVSIAIYLFSNLFIVGQDILRLATFDIGHSAITGSNFAVVGQAWSLASEILFYALCPYLLRQSSGKLTKIMLTSVLLKVLIANSPLTKISYNWNQDFFPEELGLFLAGILSCRYMLSAQSRKAPRKDKPMPPYKTALLAVLFFTFENLCSVSIGLNLLFLGLLASLLPWLFTISRTSKWDRLLGECSFPIYLLHELVRDLIGIKGPFLSLSSETLIICTLLGLIFVLRIDVHITRFRHRFFKNPAPEATP